MSRAADPYRAARLREAKRQYVVEVPTIDQAASASDTVDRIVRARLARQPHRQYRDVMLELLRQDPELRDLYNA
jgi:hypothetical protein